MEYKGLEKFMLNESEMACFYENPDSFISMHELKENQYVIICDEEGKVADKYCYQNNSLRPIKYISFVSNFGGKIKPRNLEQELAFDLLSDDRTTVKFISGGWGTGKTMIMSAAAIQFIERNKFERLVWIRNNIQLKDTCDLGALPGDSDDKLLPFAMPLADHTGGVEGLKSLIEQGIIEIAPLNYLRGRSIRNSIIMCDEAENLTREHIQLLLARVDEGSNLWLTGDCRQRDRAVFEKSQGLEIMSNKLSGNALYGQIHLEKTERSATAALADLL